MKNIFNLISIITITCFPFLNTQLVYAQTPNVVVSSTASNKISNLQARANKEIDRRIDRLNKLITRINSIKRLTSDQKSSFVSQIQTEITNLKNLKTKIAGDTDLTTLKADVRSIVTSYRVYALFIPQISLLASADRTLDIVDKVSALAAKLQSRIQTAQNKGNNVSSLQSALSDMQSKISDAKKQATNAIDAVVPLTPSGYPGNKTTLQNARTMLKTAHTDLVMARQDAKTITQGLRAFGKKTKGSPTGTIVPSH